MVMKPSAKLHILLACCACVGTASVGAQDIALTAPAAGEIGYAPVGALASWYGEQYGGSFCTGTLIRAEWVLTAAHCLEDASPANTRFFVGSDANDLTGGTFYPAREFRIHEGYARRTLANDIALVHLQGPVDGVTPIPYNTADLGPYEGQALLHIGFGAVEGVQESGKGVKRSTSISISKLYSELFESAYNGTSTCFGDSGGPALLTIEDTVMIVGVTSAGAACFELGCDPCKTATTSTRVDAYAAWIDATLGESAPPAAD
jgi:secreted trypsin-like serine protease